MKRSMRVALALIIVLLIAMLGLPGVAAAEPEYPPHYVGFIKDGWCRVKLSPTRDVFLDTTDTHSTVTPSGNTVLKCTAEVAEGEEPAKTVRVTGFLCGTSLGPTNDTMVVFTRSGKVHLTCKINGNG